MRYRLLREVYSAALGLTRVVLSGGCIRWRGKKPGNGEKGVVLGLFHQKDPKTGFRLGHKLRS
jgi:hypothetical protein